MSAITEPQNGDTQPHEHGEQPQAGALEPKVKSEAKLKPEPKKRVKKLTAKQSVFVREYVKCWNGAEAARRAKYTGNENTIKSIACENLAKPYVKEAVAAELERLAIGKEKVLARLGEMAGSNIADFLAADGSVDPAKLRDKGYLIKKLKTRRELVPEGETAKEFEIQEVEMYDAQTALGMIAKHLKLYDDGDKILILCIDAMEIVGKKYVDQKRIGDYMTDVGALFGTTTPSA